MIIARAYQYTMHSNNCQGKVSERERAFEHKDHLEHRMNSDHLNIRP